MSSTDRASTRWMHRVSVLGVAGVVVLTGAYGPSATVPLSADQTAPRLPDTAPRTPQAPLAAPALATPRTAVADRALPVDARRDAVGRVAEYPGAVMDFPVPALAAYQRAATVIDAASSCHLDWPVLAAIGRIDTANGTADSAGGTHRVTVKGVVRPAIVGMPLNGRAGRGRVDDTDAGALDHDKRYDAPVGPMALLPQTWAQVAVDADGDGQRNPQDLDDAALGAAIVLCADGKDLRKAAVLRHELTRYQDAPGFVRTALALIRRYRTQQAQTPSLLPPEGVTIPFGMPAVCGCGGHGGTTVRPDPADPTSATGPTVRQVENVPGPAPQVHGAPVPAGDTSGDPAGGGDPTGTTDPPADPATDQSPADPPSDQPPVDPPADPPADPPVDQPPTDPAPADPPTQPSTMADQCVATDPATDPAAATDAAAASDPSACTPATDPALTGPAS